MQLDRVGAAIASVDSLYLRALRARGRVAPSVRAAESAGAGIVGGLVLDSRPGLYRNILVFDFKSLYPSIIRTFNIDPLTYVPSPAAEPVVRTPGGAAFRRDEPGILPELVARLGLERARARAAGDAIAAQATKLLMNSLFGVLGSPASRLFSPAVANAITTAGQHVIRLAVGAVADLGHRVIYGDTDSLFVDLGEPDTARAAARGEGLVAASGGAVGEAVAREFGCTGQLELEVEKVYARFFMPEVRGGAMGSKKRYAGLVVTASGEEIEFVGLEAVRRDWSGVARRFQRVLLDLVFHDRPVADFIRGFVADLRAGRFDGELAYRKAIRKPLAEYTKTTPPHVKAARKQAGAAGRIVTYVMTRSGPEAVGETTAPPDYDHYVTQQLRPIADAVLRFLGGPDFEEAADRRHGERVAPDGRPRPAHRLRRADVLVGAPLDARVEVAVEAAEVVDRRVELPARRAPRLPRGRAAAEEARHHQREEVLPGRRGAPARHRRDLPAAPVDALGSPQEAVPSGVVLGTAGRADGRQPAEPGLPADQVGAVPAELAGGGDEVGGKQPLVDQVEVLPHGIGRDHGRRAHLAHQVRPVDGHRAAYGAALDHDLDRLPAERDVAAAPADRARPRLHEPLHAARLVVVGDERPAPGRLEELHEPADRRLLGVRVEDDGRHQEDRAPDAGVVDARRKPGAELLRDRGLDLLRARRREAPHGRRQLLEAVIRALEEVARGGEERLRPPAAALEHRPLGEAMQAERCLDGTERDLDPRLARRLGAVMPHQLAVADVVTVAVTEVDPPAAGTLDRPAAPAHRVRVVQEDDSLAVPREDRARDQPGERLADDHDVGLALARHGRVSARRHRTSPASHGARPPSTGSHADLSH